MEQASLPARFLDVDRVSIVECVLWIRPNRRRSLVVSQVQAVGIALAAEYPSIATVRSARRAGVIKRTHVQTVG